jgi:hypothetical protein
LDSPGIAKEIASVGTSIRSTLIEFLAALLAKLMAWQTGRQSQSLKKEISADRARARALLWKNPSLVAAPELVTEAHEFALREGSCVVGTAARMSAQSCCWTLAQVIDDASIAERETIFNDAIVTS